MLDSYTWFYIWDNRLRPSTLQVKSTCFQCIKNGNFRLTISSLLQIWSHLVNKSLMENFIFCAVLTFDMNMKYDCDMCK